MRWSDRMDEAGLVEVGQLRALEIRGGESCFSLRESSAGGGDCEAGVGRGGPELKCP
jgi:hypothetical protein